MAAYTSVNQIETYSHKEKSVLAAADNGGEERTARQDIHLKSASFSWAPDVPPFLGLLFDRLTRGQLHMVVGLVASVRHPSSAQCLQFSFFAL
jgi:hypothetical protein